MPSATADDVNVAVEATDFKVVSVSVQGSLAVQIVNPGERSVWFNACGSVLERQVEGAWVTVWHSICLVNSSDLVEIEANSSYETEVTVATELGRGEAKNWASPIDGTYRMVLNLHLTEATPMQALSVAFHIVSTGGD